MHIYRNSLWFSSYLDTPAKGLSAGLQPAQAGTTGGPVHQGQRVHGRTAGTRALSPKAAYQWIILPCLSPQGLSVFLGSAWTFDNLKLKWARKCKTFLASEVKTPEQLELRPALVPTFTETATSSEEPPSGGNLQRNKCLIKIQKYPEPPSFGIFKWCFLLQDKPESNITVWQRLNKNDKGSDWKWILASLSLPPLANSIEEDSSNPCSILRV